MDFRNENGVLTARRNGETLRIEAWGKDSLRVRATMFSKFTGNDWALTERPEQASPVVEIMGEEYGEPSACITNGRIKATVNFAGVITFYRDGVQFLREYYRSYGGTLSKESRCLKVINREWKGVIGGSDFSLNVNFESNAGEMIFGMGQ